MTSTCIGESYSGYLHLQTRISRAWKPRFFVLVGLKLQCFSSEERRRLKRVLDIRGCGLELLTLSHLTEHSPVKPRVWGVRRVTSGPEGIKQTILTLSPVRGRRWVLRAESLEDAKSWQFAIEQQAFMALAGLHPAGSNSLAGDPSQSPGRVGCLSRSRSASLSPKGQKKKTRRTLQAGKDASLWPNLESTEDAVRFLGTYCTDTSILTTAGRLVDDFNACHEPRTSSEVRMEAWKGTIQAIAKTIADGLLETNVELGTCYTNLQHMQELNLACETWVLCQVHSKVMNRFMLRQAEEDANLDARLATLSFVDSVSLGVRTEFRAIALGEAVQCFKALNRLRTPIEKAVCLRQTVNSITMAAEEVSRSCSPGRCSLALCTDDLLSLLLVVMAKAQVKHLTANAHYMEEFLCFQQPEAVPGELAYHLTNLMAACMHLQSEQVSRLCAGVRQCQPRIPQTKHVTCQQDNQKDSNLAMNAGLVPTLGGRSMKRANSNSLAAKAAGGSGAAGAPQPIVHRPLQSQDDAHFVWITAEFSVAKA